MTLDIDQLLTHDADAWRASLPPSSGPAAAFGNGSQPRGRRRHVVLAIAASVAAVLVIAGVVLGLRWSSSSSNATLGPNFAGPCQDNFAVQPNKYRPSPPLASRDLQIWLRYRGAQPCRVSAYGPHIELRDANGNLLGTGDNPSLVGVHPDLLVVRPGNLLDVSVRWSPPCPTAPRVTAVILHLGGPTHRSGAGVPVRVPDNYTPVCHSHDFAPFTGSVEAPDLVAGLTSAQRDLALRIAHQEAQGSVPGGVDATTEKWPANVDSVSAVVTTASDGARYVGGSTGATGKVLVVRLVGRFSLGTKGPPGSGDVTGNELAALIPLSSKRLSDFEVDKVYPPTDLPNSTNLFARR